MKWTDTLRSVAPVIATAIGGPLIGTGVRVLAEALGKPDATAEELQQIVTGGLTPDQLAAVKRADQEFAVKMRELDIRLDEIEAGDRKSAREREVATGGHALAVLAGIVLVGFFLSVGWVLMGQLPPDAQRLLLVGSVIGYVAAIAQQVIAYYFGSSAGSKQKTDAMAQALVGK